MYYIIEELLKTIETHHKLFLHKAYSVVTKFAGDASADDICQESYIYLYKYLLKNKNKKIPNMKQYILTNIKWKSKNYAKKKSREKKHISYVDITQLRKLLKEDNFNK